MDWTSLAQATVQFGILAFLAKAIVQHWLNTRLDAYRAELKESAEKYRVNLEHASQVEIEKLRAGLQRVATEESIRFSRVHERQAEIIAEVFARLDRAHNAFGRWASPWAPPGVTQEQKRNEASETFGALLDYFYPNAIWLDGDICNAINRIIRELHGAQITLLRAFADDGALFDTSIGPWEAAKMRLEDDIPIARRLLDRQFRELLGVAPRKDPLPALSLETSPDNIRPQDD